MVELALVTGQVGVHDGFSGVRDGFSGVCGGVSGKAKINWIWTLNILRE